MPWQFAVAVKNRMRGSAKRIAKSCAYYGRNFTSRPADNYEEVLNFCRLILERKNILRTGDEKKPEEGSFDCDSRPRPADRGVTHNSCSAREGKYARVSAQDSRLGVGTLRPSVNARPAPILLLLAGGFEHVPGGVWEVDEVVEFACAAEPEGAIDYYAFAVDVVGVIAHEVNGEVGKFFVAAETLHRVVVLRAFFDFLGGHQAREGAFGGEWAGGDGVESNVMLGPFDGERARHGEDAGFGAGRGHHVAGARIGGGVGGDDVEDVAGLFGGDPFAAEDEGAVECAGEDDSDDGVERVGREFFAASDEIAGGVIHECVDGAKFFFGGGDNAFDGREVANVGDAVGGLSAFGTNVVSGFLQGLFAAAGEKNIGAKFGEAQSHRAAQAGAASGDENCAAFQQVGLVHGMPPLISRHYSWRIRAFTARQIRNGKAKHKCKRAGETPALRNGHFALKPREGLVLVLPFS